MLTTLSRKFDSLTRLVLRKAMTIKPSVIVKFWRRSCIGLLLHLKLDNIRE